MNLESASAQHRNVVISFAILLCFAMATGIGSGNEPGLLVVAVAWGLFIYHGVSVFLLSKCLDKNKFAWVVAAIITPMLFFIPSAVLIVSSNKIFKANGWKVRFYGGAYKITKVS